MFAGWERHRDHNIILWYLASKIKYLKKPPPRFFRSGGLIILRRHLNIFANYSRLPDRKSDTIIRLRCSLRSGRYQLRKFLCTASITDLRINGENPNAI